MKEHDAEEKGFSRALYPGRFQPFHLGHLEAVRHILSNASEMIIMIGSALESHTLDNPFTAGERALMIRSALDEAGINPANYYIIPVTDLEIHAIWVAHVCSFVPKFDIVYTNEPLTRRLFIESGFNVKPIPFFERNFNSATEIRKRMLRDASWETLLPKSVARFIKEIHGVERLKDLTKTDKAQAEE